MVLSASTLVWSRRFPERYVTSYSGLYGQQYKVRTTRFFFCILVISDRAPMPLMMERPDGALLLLSEHSGLP